VKMNIAEIMKTIETREEFLMGQLRKYAMIISSQQKQIDDLHQENKDLMFQLIQKEEK